MTNALVQRIDDLQAEARYCRDLKNDRDRALALASEAQELLSAFIGEKQHESQLHAAMANIWLSFGRDELVEQEIRKALEAEPLVEPRRPIIEATQHLFFAKFLYERQRFAEAAEEARRGLELYSEAQPDGSKELTYIRQLMTPILMAGEPPTPLKA